MTFIDEGTSETEKFYGAYPLTDSFHVFGGIVNSTSSSVTSSETSGIAYESCCWALRLVGQRHLSNRFDGGGTQSTNEFDSGIALNFIFKGIGSARSSRSMLEDGMFGYRQPYVLN